MKVLNKFKLYLGSRSALLPISLIVSGLNGLIALSPFIFVWLIVRALLENRGEIAATPVVAYAWWALAFALCSILIHFVSLWMSHLAAFRVEVNMRRIAMRKILKLPLGYFDSNSTGRMRKVIDDDASATHTFVAHLLPDLAASIVSPLIVFVLFFVIDWRLGFACLVPLLAALSIMMHLMNPKNNKFQSLYLDAQEQMSGEAVEYVRGIPIVKVFQQTIYSFTRFYDSIIAYRDMVIKYTLTWQKPMSLYLMFVHGFSFFLLPTAILLIGRSGDYVGIIADMFLYLLITPIIGANVMKIMYLNQGLFMADEAIRRLENMTEQAVLPEPEQPASLSYYDISFESASFAYPGSKHKAIDDVSFSIPEGQSFALVGPSGAGKTSIARMIPRFWDLDEGAVKIGGVDLRRIGKEELMAKVSFVFQHTKLFKTSLRENILYGNPRASQEALERAIELSQSREIIDRLPQGLDTKIGAEGTYLSGGEQQRIVLARAFLKDAPIVVLDEATAFADPENEHILQMALRKLMKGKTVLMIAHRLNSVKDLDRILVIDQGRIVEQGTHKDLLAANGVYHSMWQEYQKSVVWTINQ